LKPDHFSTGSGQSQVNLPDSNSWLRRLLIGRNWKVTLFRCFFWAAATIIIFPQVLVRVQVIGISMLPTCPEHSKYWVDRLAYISHEPQRGDIVAIRLAGIHDMLLKRIIGLPGESVAFSDGRVLINGDVLDEPYETNYCDWEQPPETLTNNEYYVVGDNRTMPQQDHYHGICSRDRIIGKIWK
jgi:signal peptidase I